LVFITGNSYIIELGEIRRDSFCGRLLAMIRSRPSRLLPDSTFGVYHESNCSGWGHFQISPLNKLLFDTNQHFHTPTGVIRYEETVSVGFPGAWRRDGSGTAGDRQVT
jgi:hypothetical protein